MLEREQQSRTFTSSIYAPGIHRASPSEVGDLPLHAAHPRLSPEEPGKSAQKQPVYFQPLSLSPLNPSAGDSLMEPGERKGAGARGV